MNLKEYMNIRLEEINNTLENLFDKSDIQLENSLKEGAYYDRLYQYKRSLRALGYW